MKPTRIIESVVGLLNGATAKSYLIYIAALGVSAPASAQEGEWERLPPPPLSNVSALALDSLGGAWAAGRGAAAYFHDGAWSVLPFPEEAANAACHALVVDPRQTLWAGTSEGTLAFDRAGWRRYETTDSPPPSDRVLSLATRDTSLLVGTDRGVALFDGETWRVFTPDNSDLPDPRAAAVAFDGKGRAYLGGWIVARTTDGARWETFDDRFFGVEGLNVVAFAPDTSGALLFATRGDYDPLRHGFTQSAIVRLAGEEFRILTPPDARDRYRALAVDSTNTAWAGTYEGLQFYDGREWKKATPEGTPLSETIAVNAVEVDRFGAVWIATDNDVIVFRRE
ncbi:MAG: hypothetical protein GF419_11280 [Ignavibacteriales bacterium]|nr:hypothetical protein [Ignavibacteriales bacterium]